MLKSTTTAQVRYVRKVRDRVHTEVEGISGWRRDNHDDCECPFDEVGS